MSRLFLLAGGARAAASSASPPPRQVKVDKNVVRMAQEVQKLEDDISAALNDQTTLQKSQVTHCAGKCSGCTLRSHTPARRT